MGTNIEKILKDFSIWFLWFPVRWATSFVPLKLVYRLGDFGGWLLYKFSGSSRKIMEEELKEILNEGKGLNSIEMNEIIRRTCKLWIKNRLEVLMYGRLTREKALRFISIESTENLDKALACNKGVILLIAHFGANKHVMPALGYNGYKINQVAGKPTDWKDQLGKLGKEVSPMLAKALEKEFEVEQHLPANFIYIFESIRPIFKKLKDNEIVCFAVDGGGGENRVKVKFLGQEIQIPSGPFNIAKKTGASLVPAFIVRQKDDKHNLIIEKAIELKSQKDNGDVTETVQEFMDILSEYVRKYPCHYLNKLKTMNVMKMYGDNSLLKSKIVYEGN